jgi:phosphoribosyl 1,2-cyclic phosphodiesterase
MMQVRFWGVRGSIASGGRDMAQVGGNTSCVEIRCADTADDERDAGSGAPEPAVDDGRDAGRDARHRSSRPRSDHASGGGDGASGSRDRTSGGSDGTSGGSDGASGGSDGTSGGRDGTSGGSNGFSGNEDGARDDDGRGGGETLIVLDAGTGLRSLGEALAAARAPVNASLLLSHLHWDHIQGFPFFAPAYVPGNRVAVYAPERCAGGGDVRGALVTQMRAPHFPVGLDAMRARLSFHALAAGAELAIGPARVRAAAARHPNGCLAYRISHGGRSVVYATDTEHDSAAGRLDAELLELARGADVLIYDAQYTADEYAARRGWGHSTAEEGARLAAAAGVGQLVLFHHDPAHDDWQIARIEAATRALFPSTIAAREGLELRLAPRALRRAA